MLNTARQVEENEDKGQFEITGIWWYVYIMNIYLIVLFQTMCTWIRRIVNEDVDRIGKDNKEEDIFMS